VAFLKRLQIGLPYRYRNTILKYFKGLEVMIFDNKRLRTVVLY
jgi:hypothetical protein